MDGLEPQPTWCSRCNCETGVPEPENLNGRLRLCRECKGYFVVPKALKLLMLERGLAQTDRALKGST